MAENALTYFITLAVVCNVSVILGLVAIVLYVPRLTRRRPAHRAPATPIFKGLTVVSSRSTSPRRRHVTARAA
jgi:hypothetical protein